MRKIEFLLHSEENPYLNTETHQLWPDSGDNQTTNHRIEGPQIVQKVRGRRRAESDNGQDGTPRAIGWRGLPRHWCATNCNWPLISCLLCWPAGPIVALLSLPLWESTTVQSVFTFDEAGMTWRHCMNSSEKAWSWHAIATPSKDWLRCWSSLDYVTKNQNTNWPMYFTVLINEIFLVTRLMIVFQS